MYTKEQASKIRQQFWTVFGKYMKPVPGTGDEAINWLNYKTGIRNIYFKMDADLQKATISIELRHAAAAERISCFEQFEALKNILQQSARYDWNWQPVVEDGSGQIISRIGLQLTGVNVLKEEDWPAIIAFLKPRMVTLDAFWYLVKDGF